MSKGRKALTSNKKTSDTIETGPVQNENLSAEEQEKVLQMLQEQENKKKEHRLTVDIPLHLYEQMSNRRKETGQTMRGLIIYALKRHFNESEE